MAQRFNLTAQLQLQANSSNIAQVVSQLKKQLAPIGNVQINVQANTKSLVQANQQMATFSQNAKNANGSMGDFNRSLAESARRFSVITVATGSLLSLVNAFKKSTRAAIDFEYEMVKISQTTGQTMREVGAMSDEIRKLSTSLGVSSAELAGTARILLQAGLSADKTRKSLDILAKTTLSASFDDIQSTTEGAIALINQFRNEAARAGGDVKFLEKSLDSINAVSKAFAVESADLVDVIRKVGGVFSNAGGSVNELISLFTSVRATTRESAETIGTGLRTIFTRIQRGDTVDALKELGIELRNSQGQFVGAFEAVKRLSEGLSSLDPRDFRFAAVVEELGGYRQIGKVIPLINQFSVAQQALNVAQNASGSIAADAQTSQQALAVQINKTKEKFNEFIASLTGSESFRSIITGALKLADAFINIGKALEPVLPLLTTLFALKAGQGLASGIGILRGFAGAPSGIRASKFASGGLVPGSGNRDTVPAMLTPGEFVIRKSSVNKLGAGTLAQMNANGYMAGGVVTAERNFYGKNSKQSQKKLENQSLAGKQAVLTEKERKQINKESKPGEKLDFEAIAAEKIASKEAAKAKFTVEDGQIGGFIMQPPKGNEGSYSGPPVLFPIQQTDPIYKKLQGNAFFKFNKSNKQSNQQLVELRNRYKQDLVAAGENTKKQQAAKAKYKKEYSQIRSQVLDKENPVINGFLQKATYPEFYVGGRDLQKNAKINGITANAAKDGLTESVKTASQQVTSSGIFNFGDTIKVNEAAIKQTVKNIESDANALATLEGYIFEGMVGGVTGAMPEGGRANFDFKLGELTGGVKTNLEAFFGSSDVSKLVKAEAKRSREQFAAGANDGVIKKTINDIRAGDLSGVRQGEITKMASGGSISGSDTVPAMLTPGEFVVSKSAAQSIGYTNLNRMNKHGVQGYARGGVVGVQKFATGGTVQSTIEQLSSKDYVLLEAAAKKNVQAFEKLALELENITDEPKIVEAALKAFTRNIDKISDGSELVDRSLQAAARQIDKGMGNATAAMNDQAARRAEQQASSQQRKDLGQVENRPAGSVGVANLPTPNIVELQTHFDNLGLSVKQGDKAILAYSFYIRQGMSKQDALNKAIDVARNSTYVDAQASDQLAKEKQTLAQKLKSNIVQNAKNVGQGLGTKEGRQAFGQQINAVSGAAQNFVFLGASIAAVAGQFSSLGAATQQAITETAGFTSGLVGIGATLIQTFTSMATNSALAATTQMSNTATQQIDTTTTQAHASAVAEDTLQTKGAGAAAAGIANMFAIAAGAVVAVIAGLKFMSSRSKAQADVIEKERKARLANIAETGKSDLPIADLKKSLNEELALREWSASAMSTSTMVASGSIALAGAAGGAAIGAALGSSVPVLGTAIGAVVGVIGGLTYAYFNAEAAVNNEVAARQREVDAITKVYEAHIQLAETSYKANAALSAIESAPGLQGPEKIKRRLEAQIIGSGIGLQTARKVRPQISQDAASLGITEAQLKALTPDEIRTKGATVEGLGQKQIEGIAARAQVSFETLKMAADQAAAEVQETGKTLNDAIQNLSFSGTKSGIESIKLFNQATDDARRAIEIEQQIRLESAKTKQEEELVVQQTNNRLSAFDAGIKATQAAKQSEEIAIKRAVAAQVAMAEAARKSAVFLNSLGDQEDQIQSQSNALKNFTDSLAGNIVDISNSIKPIRNIEDPSKVTDRSRFAGEVQAVARASGNPEAAKFADQLTNAADIFARANDTLLGKTLDLGESLNANKVLKDIGLTAETFGGGAAGKKIFDNIAAELTKAAQENPVLTEEALKNILGPLSEQASTAADIINKIQSIQQQELNFRQQQLQAEQAVRDKELQAIDKYNAAVLSGVEVMARARGKSVAQARFSAEQQARQRKLDEDQARRGGVALDAADPVQLTQAKKAAEEREALVRKEINRLQAKTKLEADDIKRISELQAIQLKLKFTTQDAVEALEGLANSSAKIDMLTESLDKERAAREQAFSVLKEFVVGGAESRESLKMASQGVLSAIRTGTTQNLPEELRSQVFGLLDKLSNVEIAGSGLTGEQISKELITRDAIRLGFPPDIAIALATQTSTEEKILGELQAQTILMANAARAAAEPPATLSKGGTVYRAAGGSIFKPRGTDTIPAMLTPGEFVVNAKATSQNLGLLQAINDGGSVGGYSRGGSVRYLKDGGKLKEDRGYVMAPKKTKEEFIPLVEEAMARNKADNKKFPGTYPEDNISIDERYKRYSDKYDADFALAGTPENREATIARNRKWVEDTYGRSFEDIMSEATVRARDENDQIVADYRKKAKSLPGGKSVAADVIAKTKIPEGGIQYGRVLNAGAGPSSRGEQQPTYESYLDDPEKKKNIKYQEAIVSRHANNIMNEIRRGQEQELADFDKLSAEEQLANFDKYKKTMTRYTAGSELNDALIAKRSETINNTISESARNKKNQEKVEAEKAASRKQYEEFMAREEALKAEKRASDERARIAKDAAFQQTLENSNKVAEDRRSRGLDAATGTMRTSTVDKSLALDEEDRRRKNRERGLPGNFDSLSKEQQDEVFSKNIARQSQEIKNKKALETQYKDRQTKAEEDARLDKAKYDEFLLRQKESQLQKDQEEQKRKEIYAVLQARGISFNDPLAETTLGAADYKWELERRSRIKEAYEKDKAVRNNMKKAGVTVKENLDKKREEMRAKRQQTSTVTAPVAAPAAPLEEIRQGSASSLENVQVNSDFINSQTPQQLAAMQNSVLNNVAAAQNNAITAPNPVAPAVPAAASPSADFENTRAMIEQQLTDYYAKNGSLLTASDSEAIYQMSVRRATNMEAQKAQMQKWQEIRNQNMTKSERRDQKRQNAIQERMQRFQEKYGGYGMGYYSAGGTVAGPGGVDKVPAMLTAGEFVMNKRAVQQHGVGYMQSLNRGGNVKRFNKGGLVGGVNYLEDGGTAKSGGGFSFNFGGIQSIFDSFSGDFKGGLDNIITAFSSFGGIVGSLVSALSAGMNIVHQFSGDMTLAFNIQNGDVLKNQIAEAITPKLKEIITRELDARLDNINFKAGGS